MKWEQFKLIGQTVGKMMDVSGLRCMKNKTQFYIIDSRYKAFYVCDNIFVFVSPQNFKNGTHLHVISIKTRFKQN